MTFKTLAHIINGSSSPTSSSLNFIQFIKDWPRIIDNEFIASNSIPMKFNQQTLTIMTSHPTISHELKNRFFEIKEKIGKAFPQIAHDLEKISFYSHSAFFLQKEKNSHPPKNSNLNSTKNSVHPYHPHAREIKNKFIKDWPELANDQDLLNSLVNLQWQISSFNKR